MKGREEEGRKGRRRGRATRRGGVGRWRMKEREEEGRKGRRRGRAARGG